MGLGNDSTVLAFDLGASSGRAMLGRLARGKLALEEVHRFSNDPVRYNGELHWDMPRLWREIQNGLHLAAAHCGGELASVGVDTWGVDYALLGESGILLENPYHYRDQRSQGMVEKACAAVGADRIYGATGIQFMALNTLFQLYAAAQRTPRLLAMAERLVTIPDLLNYWLSGAVACEYTIASTTQFLDRRSRGWAVELLRDLASAGSGGSGMSASDAGPASSTGGVAARGTGSQRALGQGGLANASEDTVMQTQHFAESLSALAQSLAPIRGRKAIILFTGGQTFSQDAQPQVDAALAAANKANVAIYGISDNVSFAKTFAEATGGTAVRPTQYLPEALQQIVQEQDAYYAVTFTSASPAGACHPLRVKVDAAGVDVRARKSYCGGRQTDGLAGSPAGKELDARLAAPAAGSLGLSVQAPWFYAAGGGQANVHIVLDSVSSGVNFQKVKGKVRGELNVAGAAYREDGAVAAHFSEPVALEFNDQSQADAFLKRPYHYETQLDLPPGKYAVRAVISPAGDIWGKAETSVDIPAYDPAKLNMGAIALSTELRNGAAGPSGLDPGMIEGDTPLVASGHQIVPTGLARFQKSERLFLYTEIYEPSLTGATPAVVAIQVRVVDPVTGVVKVPSDPPASLASFVQPGNPVIPVASIVPTTKLAPGAYQLDILASHSSGHDEVLRSVVFDLTQ